MQVSWIRIIIKKLEVRRRINVFCEQIPKETVNLSTCAVLTVPPWGWSSSVSSVPTVGNSVALTQPDSLNFNFLQGLCSTRSTSCASTGSTWTAPPRSLSTV